MTQALTIIGPGSSPLFALYAPNARKAYATAAQEFAAWCAE